jgi:uncharacterized protein YdhG (YjbR/CyaY superfamily)
MWITSDKSQKAEALRVVLHFARGANIHLLARVDALKTQVWTWGVGPCSIVRMRKKESGGSSSEKRMNIAPKTVDEYLSSVAEPARGVLAKMRTLIRAALPREATEIISYRMPAFKHKRVLVWFAAFKNHCSLFPTAAVIEQFKNELKEFTTTKGAVHIPIDKPLPAALIKKLVKASLEESEGKRHRRA